MSKVNKKPKAAVKRRNPRQGSKMQKEIANIKAPKRAKAAKQVNHQQRIREAFNKYAKEVAYLDRVILNMMLLDHDYLYPREDADPTCSKLVDWTYRLDLSNIDDKGATALKLHPDPDRMLEVIQPPQSLNGPKDESEVLTIDTHTSNPTLIYLDKEITLVKGDLVAAHPGAVVKNIPYGTYYSSGSKTFKEGFKYYKTGPFVASDKWYPYVANNHNSLKMDVTCTVGLVLVDPQGGFMAGPKSVVVITVNPRSTVTGIPYDLWSEISNNCGNADVSGFYISFYCQLLGDDTVISNHKNVLGVVWPGIGQRPVFAGAYTWVTKSLWEIKGQASNSLRAEWNEANQVAVTGLDLNIKNVSAQMNLNGDLMGSIIQRDTVGDTPTDPHSLFTFLSDLPLTGFRMNEPMNANDGTHCVFPVDEKTAAFLPSDTFRELERATHFARPYMCVAVICDAPVTVGAKPALTLHGKIHLEWRTNSILCNSRRPSMNIALFNQLRQSAMLNKELGSIWTHNPDHLDKIKKFGKKIVRSDLFKTVIRDVAEVGLESLGALLLV